MQVKEIVQRVQNLYSKGVPSDDSRLTSRHIYSKLNTLRAKYIAAIAKKKQKLNQWLFQTLKCVELIVVDNSLCPCVTPPGCKILRTKNRLPKPISDLNRHLLQSVTTVDGSIIFSEVQFEEVKYKYASKYTSKKPDYFINDGYLYIIGLTQAMRHLKYISIVGLFEDPIEVHSFDGDCNKESEPSFCRSPLDAEFPIENEYIDYIIQEAMQELVILFSQVRQDSSNDTFDDSGGNYNIGYNSQQAQNREENEQR